MADDLREGSKTDWKGIVQSAGPYVVAITALAGTALAIWVNHRDVGHQIEASREQADVQELRSVLDQADQRLL